MVKTKENTSTGQEAFDSLAAFFAVPGFDMTSMVDLGRKNMETGAEISKIFADCSKEVISRQIDLLKENTKDIVSAINGASSSKITEPDFSAGINVMQGVTQRSMASVKDMGDIVVSKGQEVTSKLQECYKDSVAEIKSSA